MNDEASNTVINNTEINKNIPMLGIIQDNKLIFKAIDLLTAAAASAQMEQCTSLNIDNNNIIFLSKNAQVLNKSSEDIEITIPPCLASQGKTKSDLIKNEIVNETINMSDCDFNSSVIFSYLYNKF